MRLLEIKSKIDEKEFIKTHVLINRFFPNWIRPLDQDVLAVFDPQKNKLLQHGEVIRWIVKDYEGNCLGRIAAFVNKRYKNKGDELPIGGIGFFDCIDKQEVADVLFDTAKKWLGERGMQAMDGPINLGDRDKWWGLLVEGFHPPIYSMNFNPPYYQKLFENYGFQNFYNQICWSLSVAEESNQLEAKFYESHQKFAGNPDFQARHVNKNQLDKFAEDFCTVYNKAWANHSGNKEMAIAQARKLIQSLKPVLDEKLVWFVYHKNEPVVMWINLPDINQIVKHLKGQFGIWAKFKFFLIKTFGTNTNFVGIVYGVVPEFQGSGLDYFMIVEAEKVIKSRTGYKKLELYWQGDFNPKMLNISKNLGGKPFRKLVTYRYLFDRDKPFKRHPVID
ncbi:hypothetical protein [Rhodonellum sp.]|uniref:hypothetical protein n=1 Tax=Rhodonellum sp. TaxID=2231180 RepID=UPI00271F6BCA|nr:hypothetical protein [Rhodonellum sp.]MDO9554369.1 hypothetical protein [Rhodonellum sp.]